MKEKLFSGDIIMHGNIILAKIFNVRYECVDRIQLAQGSMKWRALVCRVMTFRFPKMWVIS
jgi:hypothetical protein